NRGELSTSAPAPDTRTEPMSRRWLLPAALAGLLALEMTPADAQPPKGGTPAAFNDKPTPEQLAFFEKKIRPVLVEKCYKCHAADAEKIRAGLTLDTRAGLRKGGDTGPAIVPGNSDRSLLIKALKSSDPDTAMPPKGKLPDDVIADFEAWVKMGAPDPR